MKMPARVAFVHFLIAIALGSIGPIAFPHLRALPIGEIEHHNCN
jgi:hypothetical protein